MRLALFDDYRLGVVEGDRIADVTDALEEHDTEWPWVFVPRTIMRFDRVRPRIEAALTNARRIPISQVKLRPPVPAPSKIAAAAANYRAHNAEMERYFARGQIRRATTAGEHRWVELCAAGRAGEAGGGARRGLAQGTVVDHRAGRYDRASRHDAWEGGSPRAGARRGDRARMQARLIRAGGYMALLDVTVRGDGDRSRRKSYRGCPSGRGSC